MRKIVPVGITKKKVSGMTRAHSKGRGTIGRTGDIVRRTRETNIVVRINLDGEGKSSVRTGIGFFDHMLETLARHGQMDVKIEAQGDLRVDDHHTVEDVGLCLGQAVLDALGDKKGIHRFGWALCPMDEALARAAVDLSGRPFCVFETVVDLECVETLQGESVPEFFKAFAAGSKATLHIDLLRGENTHHAVEAVFKSFARALRQAVGRNRESETIPSTKEVL